MPQGGHSGNGRLHSKWQLALALVRRAKSNGQSGIVLADRLLGTVTEFWRPLDAAGWSYCVGIDSTVKAWAVERRQDFRQVTWRKGSKGTRAGRFAAWRVRPTHRLSARKEPQEAC